MDEYLLFFIFLALGVFFQAFLLLRGKDVPFTRLRDITIACFVIGMLSLFTKMASLSSIFLCFSIFFSILFTIAFRDKILPVISEQTILTFTIAFWFLFLIYAVIPYGGASLMCIWPLVLVFAAFTIGTLTLSFTNIQIGHTFRWLFYAWFLFMVLIIGMFQFFFGITDLVQGTFAETSARLAGIVGVIPGLFTGMAFLYLATYFWCFLDIVPVPGRRQSWSDRIREWKEYLKLLSSKYSDSQINPVHAFLIILIEGGALILNEVFGFMPGYLLINLIIVVVPQLPLSVLPEKKI